MNRHVSRRRLVLAAFCFAVLAVVKIGYSQIPGLEPVCHRMERIRDEIDRDLETCEDFGDCEDLEIERNEVDCVIGMCWDLVDGIRL